MPEPSENTAHPPDDRNKNGESFFYKIRFRDQGQEFTAESTLRQLDPENMVMVKTDHGNEPAIISGRTAGRINPDMERPVNYTVVRGAFPEEKHRYEQLLNFEKEAFVFCRRHVKQLELSMSLIRTERFFNGSKIIFYFTADNRVDFRELVKILVQEYHTRVEMRQVGVRHETQMIGGLGCCGRELCCSSFLKKFDSVSIKMAKTQDLPLNPSKISGVCNRLLCCLTYEYETYKKLKKGMPRLGRIIVFEGEEYKIIRQVALTSEIIGLKSDGEAHVFSEKEWKSAEVIQKNVPQKGQGKKTKSRNSSPQDSSEPSV